MTITLKNFIKKLERCKESSEVVFDFCAAVPTTLDSWRGVYADLALGHAVGGRDRKVSPKTVAQLLEELRAADGKTFSGWKGGDFTMDLNTRVWVDNPGCSTFTGIEDVIDDDYKVILVTGYDDAI